MGAAAPRGRARRKVVQDHARGGGSACATSRRRERWSSYAGENGWAPPSLVGQGFRSIAELPVALDITDSASPRSSTSPPSWTASTGGWRAGGSPSGPTPSSRTHPIERYHNLSPHERPIRIPTAGATTAGPAGSPSARAAGSSARCRQGVQPDNPGHGGVLRQASRTSSSTTLVGRRVRVVRRGARGPASGGTIRRASRSRWGWMSPDEFRRSLGLAA